jgi:hypothetical protein
VERQSQALGGQAMDSQLCPVASDQDPSFASGGLCLVMPRAAPLVHLHCTLLLQDLPIREQRGRLREGSWLQGEHEPTRVHCPCAG